MPLALAGEGFAVWTARRFFAWPSDQLLMAKAVQSRGWERRTWTLGKEAASQGHRDGLSSGADAELLENAGHVGFHRALGDAQLSRDLLVGGAPD